MWNWTHVPSHAKVTATRKGQTMIRAQIRQSTCRPATVCIWKCLHMTFSLCVTARVRVCVTTVKWACPPQREKMRENLENKKRGRRQRCSKMPSVQMWVWKDTHIGTWLEIHTQQVDTKPHTHNFHFCLVWQHSWNTKVRVHVQVMAHIQEWQKTHYFYFNLWMLVEVKEVDVMWYMLHGSEITSKTTNTKWGINSSCFALASFFHLLTHFHLKLLMRR